MIKPEDLIVGAIYLVDARDFSVAIWTGEAFRGAKVRYKNWSLSDEQPWESGLPFGTATAKRRISEATVRHPIDGYNILQLLIAFGAYCDEVEQPPVEKTIEEE